jgi:uncharacterized membrane protein
VFVDYGPVYDYLFLNVGLGVIPLLLSWRLVYLLRTKRWSAWEPLIVSFLWLIFLPNSFYMVSDYIHLRSISSSTILLNAVMFTAFIFLSLAFGIISLYLVHVELKKRLSAKTAGGIVLIILLACCFAIYLGRYLRWNSWDFIVNPAGLLFAISNQLLKPRDYPRIIKTVIIFFGLIGSIYLISWRSARVLWHKGVVDMARHLRKRGQA